MNPPSLPLLRPTSILTLFLAVLFHLPSFAQTPKDSDTRIDEAALLKLGKEIEDDFAKKDPEFLFKHTHFDALFELVNNGADDSDSQSQKIRAGFISGLKKGSATHLQLLKGMKLLHVYPQRSPPEILFRLQPTNGGVNYQSLKIKRHSRHGLMFFDYYNYASGESYSQTIRRVYLPFLEQANKSLARKIFEKTSIGKAVSPENDFIKHSAGFGKLPTMVANGQFKEALAEIAKFPESMQKEKIVLLYRMNAASSIDDAEYQKALDLWIETYPNDPSIDLIQIDNHIMKKNFDKAVENVQRLNKIVEEDAYLYFLEGSIQVIAGNKEKGRELVTKAINMEPTLTEPHDLLLEMALNEKNHTEVARLLTGLEELFQVDMDAIIQKTEGYQDFLKSDEYKKWIEGRKTPPPAESGP